MKLGRMNGPYKAPTWWPCETVCPSKCTNTSGETLPLRPVHRDGLQHRTDGQRREHENSPRRRLASEWTQRYLTMHDQPFHQTPDHFVSLGLAFLEGSFFEELAVWGHDHDGAYRQLPLDDPRQAYVLLLTPEGPTLWSHNVLLFGSAASVLS